MMRSPRFLIPALLALLVLGFALLRSQSLFVRTSFTEAASQSTNELIVTPRSLSFGVDATGVLRATSTQDFGAPPYFLNYWQFQLVSMAAEGKNVKKDDVLLMFDAQKIQQDMQRYQTELDQAAKELEKAKAQSDLDHQELLAKLAAAENKLAREQLKQDGTTAALVSSTTIELDKLAFEQAKQEVDALRERLTWQDRSREARQNIIASRKNRAQMRLREIQTGMERFQVKSDRGGVVVYKTKWNGERFQIGETTWSGQALIEIPDLTTIQAQAYVQEVDIGKIKVGQTVEVTIDALPGKSYAGKVTKIGHLIHPKTWDIPNKVLDVDIDLAKLDPAVMRPSMRIKTHIETAVLANVLVVPLKSIRSSAEGTFVKIRSEGAWSDRPIELGESNGSYAVIIGGLRAGNRIALDYSKVKLP